MHKNINAGQIRLITKFEDDTCKEMTEQDIIDETSKMKSKLFELGAMETHEECEDIEDFIPLDLGETLKRGGVTVSGISGFPNE